MVKLKEIQPNEEFILNGYVFIATIEDSKVKFKLVRKNEGKVKKIKLDSIEPPSEQDVKAYAIKNGYSPDFMWEKMKGYIDAGMKDSRDNHIRNWKLKLNQVWFQPEHKIKSDPTKFTFQE